jgi:hypothetical protein
LTQASGKYYYRITAKSIHLYNKQDNDAGNAKNEVITIYGDDDDEEKECCICMDSKKEVVFVPCGHYCCCKNCGENLQPKRCPLCNNTFSKMVERDLLNLIK